MLEINKKFIRNLFLGVISCIAFYWLLNETEQVKRLWATILSVLSPFAVGASIAFIVNVPMRAIEGTLKGIKHARLRRLIALVLALFVVLLIIALILLLLIPQLAETIEDLTPILTNFFNNDLKAFLQNLINEYPELNDLIPSGTTLENLDLMNLLQSTIPTLGESLRTILSGTVSAIGNIAGAVFDGFIAFAFAIYCLFQKETLSRQGRKLAYAFLPERGADYIVKVFRLSNTTFSNFLSGQCLEVCILGCLFAITMAIFGLPHIPLVSLLVAFTAFIPVVGAWVGCAFGAFFIAVGNPEPLQAVWFIIIFIVLQQIENNLIYPRVVGTSIGLSGMWVLVAIAVGSSFMGVAGMFIMIPITSVIYALLRELSNKRLMNKTIALEKLQPHPPELSSKLFRKSTKCKKKDDAAATNSDSPQK